MHKLIRLTWDQANWVRSEAARLGISGIEVIRRLIDKAMGEK
jgi:hypothetical protein